MVMTEMLFDLAMICLSVTSMTNTVPRKADLYCKIILSEVSLKALGTLGIVFDNH